MSEIREAIAEARRLNPPERLEALETAFRATIAERRLQLLEHTSLLFGAGGNVTIDLVHEDPLHDDHQVWDETGLAHHHAGVHPHHLLLPTSEVHLQLGRRIGRQLAQENEFARGAHKSRVSYIVGDGITWRAVPKDPDTEDDALTRAVQAEIDAFLDREHWCQLEQEIVRRCDRDGETFLRLFPSGEGLRVRVTEPEDVINPPEVPAGANVHLGVETEPGDVRSVLAYWIAPSPMRGHLNGQIPQPERVPLAGPLGIPNVIHLKLNVDLNRRRGWPTFWAIRRNLARAGKLQRAMTYTASLQATIALIRKFDTATRAEVESFLDADRDLLVTNQVTGKERRHQGMLPGSVINAGPGISYEAPIMSINAANLVAILQSELRSAAADLQQPEFMFTADASNANFASTLVAESPSVKNFQRLQGFYERPFVEVHEANLRNAAEMGRLPADVLERYDVVGEFPQLIFRDRNAEAGRFQIEADNGIVSPQTWRMRAGYDDEIEERHLAEHANRLQERGLTGPLALPDEEDDEPAGGEEAPAGTPVPAPPGAAEAAG